MSNDTYPWNSENVLQWIPQKDNETLDSCHLFDENFNETVGCEAWVYDSTYHPSSRVIEVKIPILSESKALIKFDSSTVGYGVR